MTVQRKVEAEWLDVDQGSERDVRQSLRDLQRINTLFGGVSSTVAMLRRVANETHTRKLSLLEVASGAGFVPQRARVWLAGDVELEITLLDRAATHLPENGGQSYVGDALALPFPENSFDVISCGLFLHHLDPKEVLQFARESLRVARRALVISDLIRSRLHLLLAHLSLPLYGSPITWHDSLASIRAAYTPPEVREMLRECGARKVEIQRQYLYRMGVIVWK
ncbi:MAG TPA: methyltransferase domain-containing protein [Candidatus Koribacter sp.]